MAGHDTNDTDGADVVNSKMLTAGRNCRHAAGTAEAGDVRRCEHPPVPKLSVSEARRLLPELTAAMIAGDGPVVAACRAGLTCRHAGSDACSDDNHQRVREWVRRIAAPVYNSHRSGWDQASYWAACVGAALSECRDIIESSPQASQ